MSVQPQWGQDLDVVSRGVIYEAEHWFGISK